MDKQGAGLAYISDFYSDDMRVFKAGLKNVKAHSVHGLVKGTRNSVRAYHDKMNYERGFIQHSRSNANQYVNFHFMYGGLRKYLFERFFYGIWYKKNIRQWWLPVLLGYSFGAVTMRMYDNAAHDFFYFSD